MDRFCSGIERLIIDYLGATFTVGSQLEDGSPEAVYRQILNILEMELAPAYIRPMRVGIIPLRVAMFVAENAWVEILSMILRLPRIYDGYIDEIIIAAARSGSAATLNIALFEVCKKESPSIQTLEKAMIEAVGVNSVGNLQILYQWMQMSVYPQSSRRWTWRGINYYRLFCYALMYNRPEIYRVLRKMFRRVPLKGRCKLVRLAGLSGNRQLVQMCLLHTRMAGNPQARGFVATGAIEGGHFDLAREAIGEGDIAPSTIWRMFDTAVICGRVEGLKLVLQTISPDQLKQRQLQKSAWSAFLILRASHHAGMLECLAECGVLNGVSLKRALNRVRSHHMESKYNKERLNQWRVKSAAAKNSIGLGPIEF
jgi:hypothetical protein